MSGSTSSAGRSDGRLWAIAFGLSLVFNVLAVVGLGLAALRAERLRTDRLVAAPPLPETSVVIFQAPEAAPVPAEEEEPDESKPRFARTSEDQAAERPNRPAFIGERDTQATSDRAPDRTAPELPSQAGIEPREPGDLETTESDYQDGEMAAEAAKPAPVPQEATPPAPPEPPSKEVVAEAASPPESRPREELATSAHPVDLAVPKVDAPEQKPQEAPKEMPQKKQVAKAAQAPPQRDPAFAGFQQKKAIIGNISRTGRSALDVADTPLGRYQAVIGRAVELEWQRNCVRHRDFIVPGYLTARFYVEPNGKVKTVQFVGEMDGNAQKNGQIQKGFTLSSIRDAEIPPMPATLKKEYKDAPMELLINFYF